MSETKELSVLIGFIGAPGCGKTTTALGLTYRLKKEEIAAEFIPEAARQKIIECRIAGIPGNGGLEGQKNIYAADTYLHGLYRNHANSISITDGSTVNCFFYGLQDLDLADELAKYDLSFYIPLTDTAYKNNDANRLQKREEILRLGALWESVIAPLEKENASIIRLNGYPHATPEEMIENAYNCVLERFNPHKIAA